MEGATWFGHPRGLSTLFFTELWERFSYYGMRALLILYMTAAATGTNPGLDLTTKDAGAIYGIYAALVYLAALPGGWVADRFWGARNAVFVGGCIIASGHFTLAGPLLGLPELPCFFLGLLLIVIGTGLLKPNISVMVGSLYSEDARRDAGFSIFYMGINLGGILGLLVCPFLAENYDWHMGFSAAGVGMVLGLLQYRLGARHLGTPEPRREARSNAPAKNSPVAMAVVAGVAIAAVGTAMIAAMPVPLIAKTLGYAVLIAAGFYFAYLFIFAGLSREEKRRLSVIVWLFLLAALFWSGFEQAGSSLNLFTYQMIDRDMAGFTVPAGWFQMLNPIYIIILAPVFGMLWTWAATRSANPSIPVKFALGLSLLSAGFFVIAWGAANAGPDNLASPAWLVVMYFLHTCGEICLSPVGLSAMAKLSPAGRTGQMMGVWFIAAALGNLFAGLAAGSLESLGPGELFLRIALFTGVAGLVAFATSPLANRLGTAERASP